jgi:cytoskeletal protein CcmA (bactofilin family)
MNEDRGYQNQSQNFDTIVGPSVSIEGDFLSKGNVRIEGMLKGRLETEQDIEVAESAKIDANVTANNMVIAGQVSGDIKAQGKITILETGRVQGDITSGTLAINPGALFSGQSNMTGGAAAEGSDAEEVAEGAQEEVAVGADNEE